MSAQPEHLMAPKRPEDLKGLYDQHSRMILRTAWRITGSLEDAEDVLQQIFLRMLRSRSAVSISSITGGYLRRAAVNTALDIVRSRRVRPDQPIMDGSRELEKLESTENPEEGLRSRDLADALLEAVSHLNERAAEVFILRDIEGLSNSEIAVLLDTTPNTVTVTYHRARTRLLEMLADWEGPGGQAR